MLLADVSFREQGSGACSVNQVQDCLDLYVNKVEQANEIARDGARNLRLMPVGLQLPVFAGRWREKGVRSTGAVEHFEPSE